MDGDMITAKHLSAGYGRHVIINNQTIHIPTGKITGLIGPNGSGKTTLFNVLNGFEKPLAGEVLLSGNVVSDLSAKQRALQVACLAQHPTAPAGITVQELVNYGRYAHHVGFRHSKNLDRDAVKSAINEVHLNEFTDRQVSSLSGGQRQRAFIAMTLAQDSPIMMLDEPTTYLDLTNQLEILELLQELNRTLNKTIIIILHDLNQAAAYCQHLICLAHGTVQAVGTPKSVLTKQLMAEVFQVSAEITTSATHDCPQMLNCHPLEVTS